MKIPEVGTTVTVRSSSNGQGLGNSYRELTVTGEIIEKTDAHIIVRDGMGAHDFVPIICILSLQEEG